MAGNPHSELHQISESSARSFSEILQLGLLFLGSLVLSLLLGCFFGGFAGAWDSVPQFLAAVVSGQGWGLFVAVSACMVSCLVSIWAFKTRFFADKSQKEQKTLLTLQEEALSQFFQEPNLTVPPELLRNQIAGYLYRDEVFNLMRVCKGFVKLFDRETLLRRPLTRVITRWDRSFISYDNIFYSAGASTMGQLGRHSEFLASPVFSPILGKDKNAAKIKQIAIGQNHTIALFTNGELYGCGFNDNGQLGIQKEQNFATFTLINPPDLGGATWKQIAAGPSHTLAVSADGRLYGCGADDCGQLGLGYTGQTNFLTFMPIGLHDLPSNSPIKQVAAGTLHTVILLEDGRLYGCGNNAFGQLGLDNQGTTRRKFTQLTIPRLGKGIEIKQVVVGGSRTFVLFTNGELYGCGQNGGYQLATGDQRHRTTFTQLTIPDIEDGAEIKQVAAGEDHTIVLLTNGKLYGCGRNVYGQLGLVDKEYQSTFTRIFNWKNAPKIKYVAAGSEDTIVLSVDEELYGCGRNVYGQLGLGDKVKRNIFTKIPRPVPPEKPLENIFSQSKLST
jgi:alpha-tubulin suppressor-like RCC1 family protein